MVRILLGIAVCLVGVFGQGTAHAGTNTWHTSDFSHASGCNTDAPSISAAQDCYRLQHGMEPHGPYPLCTTTYDEYTDATGPLYGYRITYRYDNTDPYTCTASIGGATSNWSFTDECDSIGEDYEYNSETGACWEPPPPFDCGTITGNEFTLFFPGTETTTEACNDPSEGGECRAVAVGTPFCNTAAGECVATMRYTGASCGATTTPSSPTMLEYSAPTNCISGSGMGLCFAADDKNCGTVNGEAVCLDSIPSNGCTFLTSGGMICEDGASTPPAPTDSGGSSPATPDGSFAADSGTGDTTYNYYGGTTVTDSGTPTTGTQTELPSEGEEGEGECAEPEDCPIGLPEIPDPEDAGVEAEAAIDDGVAGLLDGPLDGLDVTLGAGECPTASGMVAFIDTELTIDAHCALAETIRSPLAAVMLLIWALLGVRILMET